MRNHFTYITFSVVVLFSSCNDDDDNKRQIPNENISAFAEIGHLDLEGGETAAEISAYDPSTKKLFVVNAVKNTIDILNMADPNNLIYEDDIDISTYGGGINSVSVKEGMLAAAIESDPKTNPGKIVVWRTSDLSEQASVTVGSLPDMVTFSPDGKYIVSANEGEPSEDYSIDPKGSVSIIDVTKNFEVTILDFTSFNASLNTLRNDGYRVFGMNANLADDTEPEYVAISHDSKTAWVTLQENNALAKVDLVNKTIIELLPLGFKDHSLVGNELDPSDRDEQTQFSTYPIRGIFLPDAIAAFTINGTPYVITANEGDSRLRPTGDDVLPELEEGDLFNEEERIKDIDLDPTVFPNAEDLQSNEQLGRLKVTITMGDVDDDGDFDQLYTFGTRSFSIWNGSNGDLVFDSGNKLETFINERRADLYPDDRSDDKGVEPEGVAVGMVNNSTLAFVGLERADAIVIVDITNPSNPLFLQVLETGDAPEGILFIPAEESPNGRSLLVVSSEGDGTVKVYQPSLL